MKPFKMPHVRNVNLTKSLVDDIIPTVPLKEYKSQIFTFRVYSSTIFEKIYSFIHIQMLKLYRTIRRIYYGIRY